MSKQITCECPRCKQIADHKYNGMQRGLPMKDKDGNKRVYTVPLYTCPTCGSTWADVDNRVEQ